MDAVVEHCQRAVDAAQAVVDLVTDADLDRPTPCADWTVRELVAHMIWMQQVFAAGLTGDAMPPEPAEVHDGDDVAAAYSTAGAAAMEAWRTTEWAEMTLQLPFSKLPAAIGVRVCVGDALIHTWDLATALGRPFQIPEDLARPQLELMQQFYDPANRGPQAAFDLATDCPPGASTSDHLIALSGRRLSR
jgi:uncharacterized protein (TIGR03086 family)